MGTRSANLEHVSHQYNLGRNISRALIDAVLNLHPLLSKHCFLVIVPVKMLKPLKVIQVGFRLLPFPAIAVSLRRMVLGRIAWTYRLNPLRVEDSDISRRSWIDMPVLPKFNRLYRHKELTHERKSFDDLLAQLYFQL